MALACLLVGVASHALAQEPDDPAETARFRLGPIRFTPSIAVTGVGVDDNVFNESVDQKRDTTAAVGPAANVWMRLGRSRVSGKVSGQYLYFKQYDNQRSWNTNNTGRWEVPMARVTPFVSATYVNTRERPGFEIDSRARQRNDSLGAGTEIRLAAKTTFVVTASRANIAYDRNETFLGAVLSNALDRKTNSGEVQFHYRLTPLTTLAVTAEGLQDRFVFEPIRDSQSVRVLSGFETKPFALVSGKALVGYRRFDARDASVPDYQGVIASVDVKYSLLATQLGVKVARDLSYSFELAQPYYALTDRGVSVTERVTHTWDVVARASWQTLDYRHVSTVLASSRVDKERQYGLGLGYRLGGTTRLGVDADHYRRRTGVGVQRDYEGLRIGGSLTYGLQP